MLGRIFAWTYVIIGLVGLAVLATARTPQQPPVTQQRAIVTAWNECGTSIKKENELITRLTKSLQLNPPWLVVDAQASARRAELIDKIIVEHRRRIVLLEKIKRAEQ